MNFQTQLPWQWGLFCWCEQVILETLVVMERHEKRIKINVRNCCCFAHGHEIWMYELYNLWFLIFLRLSLHLLLLWINEVAVLKKKSFAWIRVSTRHLVQVSKSKILIIRNKCKILFVVTPVACRKGSYGKTCLGSVLVYMYICYYCFYFFFLLLFIHCSSQHGRFSLYFPVCVLLTTLLLWVATSTFQICNFKK